MEDPTAFAVDNLIEKIETLSNGIVHSPLPGTIVEPIQRVPHVAFQCRKSTGGFTPECLAVRGKALIQPDVRPGSARYQVPPPLMRKLVGNHALICLHIAIHGCDR